MLWQQQQRSVQCRQGGTAGASAKPPVALNAKHERPSAHAQSASAPRNAPDFSTATQLLPW